MNSKGVDLTMVGRTEMTGQQTKLAKKADKVRNRLSQRKIIFGKTGHMFKCLLFRLIKNLTNRSMETICLMFSCCFLNENINNKSVDIISVTPDYCVFIFNKQFEIAMIF